MSSKRSRANFEADLTTEQSPFVAFGTPLPPLDAEIRDDGSFVPVWKQEARDEQGRKRFHGAFTGGWSAGYFNTVGSKEGWTPSTFVSSRSKRHKDEPRANPRRPEDFMDAEDLADAEEARKIQTNDVFAGLGSTSNDSIRASGLLGVFPMEGETMGTKLLKKMGWKEGQGIGPKVRREARLELKSAGSKAGDTYLFAPENVAMIDIERKTDRKGLGFEGGRHLTSMGPPPKPRRTVLSDDDNDNNDDDDDDDDSVLGRPRISTAGASQKKMIKGSLGVGVLNDTGSDDEDPHEMGPRISYNRVIVGEKKKKAQKPINPSIRAKPTFIAKRRANLGNVGLGVRKCHDGRSPLPGFVFGRGAADLASSINGEGTFPPPNIPPGWKSSKLKIDSNANSGASFVSTADAAKASTLDPKTRATLLGEKQLPGKSVFDFMSESARARLAAASGKTNLPPAKAEIPAGFAKSSEDQLQELLLRLPRLEKETAVAALARGATGVSPYGNDEEKGSRYRAYLEFQAGLRESLPQKPAKAKVEDWTRELQEFYNCARIFRPMTGLMASRFTTSTSVSKLSNGTAPDADDQGLLTKPAPKPTDPAEEAAKMGMYGPMTRTITDFYPTRLLCKRFNVKPPSHVQPDEEVVASARFVSVGGSLGNFAPAKLEVPALEYQNAAHEGENPPPTSEKAGNVTTRPEVAYDVAIDSTKNEALEGKRAGQEVLRAIFGDSDEED